MKVFRVLRKPIKRSLSNRNIQTKANSVMSKFSRRDFLKTGAISSLFAGAVVTGCTPTNGQQRTGNWKGKAKNIIFMVSDGMSMGTLSMADHMSHIQRGVSSAWVELYEKNMVRRGFMDMASANSIVTDSAAAASSWGCGQRVVNNSVNMAADGTMFTPVMELFKNAGKKTGLVTTTRITHATPAGFIANVANRGMEHEIAVQMLERGADVFMGGGNRFFSGSLRNDNRDLYTEFEKKGYHVARSRSELMAIPSDNNPMIGIFTDEHLPFTVDHVNIPELRENVPTLAEMTDIALKRLHGSNGFLLQVEGGRVDHGAHANDATGMIFDQLAFDDAIRVALEYIHANPETLLVITTDHGNANPGLNGDGDSYNDSNSMFESLTRATRSNDLILAELNRNDTVSRIREVVEHYTTHAITAEQAGILRQAMRREYSNLYKKMSSQSAVMGQILANYTAVNFIGNAHTSDLVELAVMGPGSEAVNGFVKNTDMFTLMLESAGVPSV